MQCVVVLVQKIEFELLFLANIIVNKGDKDDKFEDI